MLACMILACRYDTQDGVSYWTWPLHMCMVILGAFFLINLALAVLYLFFTKDRIARELQLWRCQRLSCAAYHVVRW